MLTINLTFTMDQQPDMPTVYAALDALYRNTDPSSTQESSKWLTALHESIYAWKIADTLLHDKWDVESFWFAAQTLKKKTQNAFHELPVDCHQSLRDSLLEILEQTNENSPSFITVELGLVVTNMLLQMTNWNEPIQDLMHKLAVPDSECPTTLIQVLKLLPEELGSSTWKQLGQERKRVVLRLLAASTEGVFRLLDGCISLATVKGKTRVMECFTSWIYLSSVTPHQMGQSAVLSYAFDTLVSTQSDLILHDSATELVCKVIGTVADRQKALPFSAELENFADALIKNISSLGALYRHCVSRDDTERATNFCRIFTEISEAVLPRILRLIDQKKDDLLLSLVDLVSMCTSHPDYEVVQITFGFWHKLSEDLDNQRYISKFKPHIQKLTFNLHRLCHMKTVDYSKGDDFPEFRCKVDNLIRDLVSITDSASVFKYYSFKINPNANQSWPLTEASLFMMQAVAEHMVSTQPAEDIHEVVHYVVETSLTLVETANTAVVKASLLLLKSLSRWMELSLSSGRMTFALLERVLSCVAKAMCSPVLSATAAGSFTAICTACPRHLISYIGTLIQMIEALASMPNIPDQLSVKIVRAVTMVSCHLPREHVSNALFRLCEIQLKELNQICQGLHQNMDPVCWLDRLVAIFDAVGEMNGVQCEQADFHSVLAYTESVLLTTFTMFQNEERVMECACRCFRYALRSCRNNLSHPPLSEPLITKIVELYSTHHYSCFLYLAGVMFKEYNPQEQYIGSLIRMVEVLVSHAFTELQKQQGSQKHADTIDDLFRLLKSFVNRRPVVLAQSPALPTVVDCAIQACSSNYIEASESAKSFLKSLSKQTNYQVPREVC